ncbi:MAG: hypothetical protein MKZ59_06630 [Deinococcales bacterium]|nr:hypothetical protein [Deinococcales bacterium]
MSEEFFRVWFWGSVLVALFLGFIGLGHEFVHRKSRPSWLRKTYWPVALIILLTPIIWLFIVAGPPSASWAEEYGTLGVILAAAISWIVVFGVRKLGDVVRKRK